jgi:hypothetical protein
MKQAHPEAKAENRLENEHLGSHSEQPFRDYAPIDCSLAAPDRAYDTIGDAPDEVKRGNDCQSK